MTHAARTVAGTSGFGRRLGSALAVALTATAGLAAVVTASAAAATPQPRASQPLVVLQQGHVARAAPSRDARRIEYVAARRPLTGVRTVLPVLGRGNGGDWIRVRLPGRPNGHAGWIRAAHTRRTSTLWRLSLDLSARRVTVRFAGRVERRFDAVIGTSATPTPLGRFFVEEGVRLAPWHAGGPYALATSARSNVLQEFAGGPGQIALHGTAGLAGTPGSAASHGCIRLSTGAITWLARRIGAGVPLTVAR
ncbi:MAG TPA: L,D-transpeptidase [Thermoleophilaceae bacterium]|nr:L,D-transpeptidase [Thermoleophilaceae bacterium]